MSDTKHILLGPFTQLAPMSKLPLKGPLSDDQLGLIESAGVLISKGYIEAVGDYKDIKKSMGSTPHEEILLTGNFVGLPGFIDCHTHICFAGSRAKDYAARNSGKTYLEIAGAGGGIWDTVRQTRQASEQELTRLTTSRATEHLSRGTTTIEVKSGYGLDPENELKMLSAIAKANETSPVDLIATCLAAHTIPKDRSLTSEDYLNEILNELLPEVKSRSLASRVDIFIEEGAFKPAESIAYVQKAKEMGFEITIHADQFSVGGSRVAVECGARSADHLEASTDQEIELLAQSDVIPVALPGASLGLGCGFTPARSMLDAGGSLAIASDHNPGSAPMGDLVFQAAVLGTMQQLSQAEVLAGITYRAAAALGLTDRGVLEKGKLADLCIYNVADLNEVLYHQGSLKPALVLKKGKIEIDLRMEAHV
ncbi:MAG: imidazolonepropionase [Flavobacteriaceae bacterium]|nr:imidazolonepropionase [Flavobacteriaceae bacterium]